MGEQVNTAARASQINTTREPSADRTLAKAAESLRAHESEGLKRHQSKSARARDGERAGAQDSKGEIVPARHIESSRELGQITWTSQPSAFNNPPLRA